MSKDTITEAEWREALGYGEDCSGPEWKTGKELRAIIGRSKRATARAVEKLMEQGRLAVGHRNVQRTDGVMYKATVYRLKNGKGE